MKSIFSLLTVIGSSLLLLIAATIPAEAKRLGGGNSFGSKFSHNDSVKRSSNQTTQKQDATPAQQQNMQQKQQMSNKGGLMGILGGLAIGGLLGAMFFGGAFENINLFDIILFAVIALVLFKLISSRFRAPLPTPATSDVSQSFHIETEQQSNYRETPSSIPATQSSFGGITLDELRGDVAGEFDKDGFLEGAKSCYARLQNAWDGGDIADIRQFTTDHVFAEIQDQMRSREKRSETKILALNAELISAQQLGQAMEATVLFEANLTEDGEENLCSEVWHFVRPAGAITPTWYLDGIQQVED